MRIFLAIDLAPKVKDVLYQGLSDMRKEYPSWNWIDKENYHITLYFFGEVDEQNLPKLKSRIQDALYDQEHFYLYSQSADLFMKQKLTLFLTFRREKKIEELVGKLNTAFYTKNGQRFIPHLTFARCKIPSKQQYFLLQKKISRISIDLEFVVDKIILFQSVLEGKKPIYKKLEATSLM